MHAGDVGYIEHTLIHADTADHRRLLPVNQHIAAVGQAAAVAVGVADRDGGNPHLPRCGIGAAVADGFAGRHRLDHGDARFQRHDRAQAERFSQKGGRSQAVQNEAGTHHVQVHLREAQHGRAVAAMPQGEGYAAPGELLHRLGKAGVLAAGKGLAVLLVRYRKMGENALGPQMRQAADCLHLVERLSGVGGRIGKSDARHARVHLQVYVHRDAGPGGRLLQAAAVLRVNDRLRDPVLRQPRRLLGRGVGQDQDRLGDTRLPQLDALLQI